MCVKWFAVESRDTVRAYRVARNNFPKTLLRLLRPVIVLRLIPNRADGPKLNGLVHTKSLWSYLITRWTYYCRCVRTQFRAQNMILANNVPPWITILIYPCALHAHNICLSSNFPLCFETRYCTNIVFRSTSVAETKNIWISPRSQTMSTCFSTTTLRLGEVYK